MFRSPFSFEGRIRRLEYGLSYVLYWSWIVLIALLLEYSNFDDTWALIPHLAAIYFVLAQGAKRCHDMDKSGFYQLIPFYIFVMFFQEGQPHENKHGTDPKETTLATSDTPKVPGEFSFQKLLAQGLPAILLNILLVAIGIEYLGSNVIGILFWLAFTTFVCNFLMLLTNGFGNTVEKHTKTILLFNLLFAFILYMGVRFYSVYFGEADFTFSDLSTEFILVIMFYVVTIFSFIFYYLLYRNRNPRNVGIKYPTALSILLFVSVFILGFANETSSVNKEIIPWSLRSLVWDDFELVDHMEEDYVALIYSNIACPNLITDNDSRVYAFMNPNYSERLRDEYDGYNVLIHEQYHFNITEYCARLLRKDLVESGLGGLSLASMKSLQDKYAKKLDSLQDVYDSITDHNSNTKQQRYWELKIDDWLRQTAYYKNEDIYSYYDFTKNRTQFYRHIYFTADANVLTSYPIGEKDIEYGETYEISYVGDWEKEIKFYKNGELTNGGYFKTAIAKIRKKQKGPSEIHYYNPDRTYNTKISAYIRKRTTDENKNSVERYYTEDGQRTLKNAVFETRWRYNPAEESYYGSYFDKNGRKIAKEEGIFHVKRTLDKKGRTVRFENFDRHHRLKNDDGHIARYEYAYDENNLRSSYRLYNENGDFAFHLNDYHLSYAHDERGNVIKVTSLDEKGENTYDHNGASIYEYTYDLYDRETSVKRFNAEHGPIIANDDYFYKAKDYDSVGRVAFEAYYYPGYVLRFTDNKYGALKYSYPSDSIILEYNADAYNTVFESDEDIAITRKTLNTKKEVVKETYLDADENFAKIQDGAVTYTYTYDSGGNKIETVAYDSIGNPKEFEEDVAIIRWEYDDRGNKLKTTYFNANDELANATDSVTYNVYKYNAKNQLIERSNYNIKMDPAQLDGTFKTHFYINKAGLDSVAFEYNKEGRLKKGVAITKYFYNLYGNQTRVEYYDSNHQRTSNGDGVSAIDYRYNKRQKITGYEYFDERNRRTNNQYGVAIERSVLDELGHTLTYAYFDRHGRRTIGENGYHKVAYEWDDMGQTTKATTYGDDNKLIEDELGIAIYKYTLAPSGLIQVIERYNKDGVLAENTDHVATSHYEPKLNGLYYLEKELNILGEVVNDSISE
ncbi:DUF805 domain-containing protein [Flavobacteriaceae bacterium 3-367]